MGLAVGNAPSSVAERKPWMTVRSTLTFYSYHWPDKLTRFVQLQYNSIGLRLSNGTWADIRCPLACRCFFVIRPICNKVRSFLTFWFLLPEVTESLHHNTNTNLSYPILPIIYLLMLHWHCQDLKVRSRSGLLLFKQTRFLKTSASLLPPTQFGRLQWHPSLKKYPLSLEGSSYDESLSQIQSLQVLKGKNTLE